jgi:hypothetical protein
MPKLRFFCSCSGAASTHGFASRAGPDARFHGLLSGSVSDSTGARVPNAKVTLNNPEKGITRALLPIQKAISPSRFCRLEPIP